MTQCCQMLSRPLLLVLFFVASLTGQTKEARVDSVELQPLLAQVKRLGQALEQVGRPLPKATLQQLAKLDATMDQKTTTQAVQRLLDPFCVASVVIDKKGRVQSSAGTAKPELLQEGWRNFLVKVVNHREVAAALFVASPNAGDKPGAPSNEVNDRWMDVGMFDGRPMMPRLSGLKLEYRILQVFSSVRGQRTGELQFSISAESPEDPAMIAEWTFEKDDEGFKPVLDTKLQAVDGQLVMISPKKRGPTFTDCLTNDPKLTGKLEIRFWLQSPTNAQANLLWANGPLSKGNIGQARYSIKKGAPREYRVIVNAEEAISGFRITATHNSKLDWVRISRVRKKKQADPSTLRLTFHSQSATDVTLRVVDELGKPATASFLIRDEKNRVYPTPSKRLAPDFFFHPQVYRSDGEKVSLPPGRYTITCSRGPESIPQIRKLTVGDKPIEFAYQVKRWVDPAAKGWYSGDHHIHAAGCAHYANPTQGVHAIDMARHCMGEDLKVGCNLTWGPCFDYQKQFFTGKVAEVSQYPYLLRYDVEVSGFGSHVSGHLCLLRLTQQIFPGGESKDHWPTLGLNTLRWAKAQGAICGPAHSSAGLQPTKERVEGKDGPPLPGWTGFGNPRNKPVTQLPNFFIPAYSGIGANEFVVDITHNVPGPQGKLVPAIDFISSMNTDRVAEWNMWYHSLNCGFRVKTSGETDFPCVTGARVGIGRVYVKMKGKLDYDDWCQGLTDGRSYVSDGTAHLMSLTASHGDKAVELGYDGSELKLEKPSKIKLKLVAAVRRPSQKTIDIELIRNGYPIEKRTIAADGKSQSIEFETEVEQSSWFAIRAAASAHTNPIFVLINNKPIRASAASARWLLRGVDVCWKSKQKTYAKDEQVEAKAAYDHARKVYQKILDESEE